MLTRHDIAQAERVRNRQVQRMNDTSAVRAQNREMWAAWENACDDFHGTQVMPDYLWSDEARLEIRNGDRETIGDALLFLEVDPWYFRSGYLKETLLDELKGAPFTDDEIARIHQIIITVACGRNRRVFRRYCKLAAKVTSPQFEENVARLAKEHNSTSCGKLSYLLRCLAEHRTK